MQRKTSVALVGLVLVSALVALAAPRDASWKKVEDAMNKGLPKTAIAELKPIIAAAIQEKKYAEAIKAIAKSIALEGNIQGNKPEEKIVRLREEIAKAPAEMKPVLEAIQANWFWHYYQQNRWRFLQRSQTAAPPGDDFTTWDLPRILGEIDKQFAKALANPAPLQATKIAEYDDLLQKGTLPDAYRPTLYDFLVHNALEFYTAGEQAAAKAEDAFELPADGPIFAPADDFAKWQPETSDADSVTLKAVRLFQSLLRFHAQDADRSAALDADLARLEFGHNKAIGDEKDARYKAALRRIADQAAAHELSSRALFLLATQVHAEGESVEARKIALQGQARFPNSVGGKQCYNLVQQIEAREVQVQTERVWNAPWPTLDVTYRNITKLHFRAVAYDFSEFLKKPRWSPEHLEENERKALLARPPALAWSADLPATDDYKSRTERLPANADLKPGSYYLIASPDPKFAIANNPLSFADFWVSDLALVTRTRQGEGTLDGFVLNAITGEPLAEATVQAWRRTNNGARVAGPVVKTDANGLFRFTGFNQQSFLLDAKHGTQRLATANDYWVNIHDTQPQPFLRTIFFTDRSLYRPGQTIHYKGLAIDVNQRTDAYKVLAKRNLTVLFNDVNGKEIERRQHQTNDYGSFSGSFTAPRDRLMGQMTIVVAGGPNAPHGATHVNVEEYKRPKFVTTLDAPKTAAKLNGEVQLAGKATAYTGAAIDGAKVRWRVVREVRFPIWWYWRCWWMPPQPDRSQEIAHGSAVTDAGGSFSVSFVAKPDATVAEKDEPTFSFTVYADVTDNTGETRSAQRSVQVGYTALQATLTANDWQQDDKPVAIEVRTTTLDGEGQTATGSLKVYRLKQPPKVLRARIEGQPYIPFWPRKGVVAPGGDPAPDPANVNSWPLGEVAFEKDVTTDGQGNAKLEAALGAGIYRAKLTTQDRFGKPVTADLPIRVLAPTADKLALRIPDLLAAPKWQVEPGQELTALWGTGYDTGRAFVEVEHRQKLVQSYWTPAGRTQVQIKQAITEAMRGGFTVRVTHVRENRAYLHSQHVDVPWSNKNLTVKWERFVSKLEPNQKETWTAIVSGPDAQKAVAEMVAGLYDASLDAYLAHGWPGNFGVFRQDHSYVQSQFENQWKQLQHMLGHWPMDQKDASFSYRTFPGDIIQNFWGFAFFGQGKGDGRQMLRGLGMGGMPPPAGAPMATGEVEAEGMTALALMDAAGAAKMPARPGDAGPAAPLPGPDLSQVSARKNLQETAFFFPHLIASADGSVRIEFTMPEALTEWKFLGFAHDRDLRSGVLNDKIVSAKDLMVQPNPPRFLREGDVLEFTVKVSNQSAGRQTGKVRLSLADARTAQPVDAAFGNAATDLEFDIPAKESRTLSWRLAVPDDASVVTYKTVGSTGRLSDGEEGLLPVLSRRVLVTESLPLPIRGKQTKPFRFERLAESGQSNTLKHKSLTVQMVSNPSWYAVLALPYLMDFPHECTEQTFNRLYANSLARHIAGSDPKIRRIFDQWKGTPALDSPLEKNQDLKSVMLEETPWVRQAQAESQARRNVGILFDDNRLNDETARLLRKLAEQQLGDGAWPWFPGGPPNDYITLYITTGFGRLRHLGVKLDMAPALKSLSRLDGWADRMYREVLKHAKNKDDNHLSSTIALYLYCRSFFLADQPIAAPHQEAVTYWLGQSRKYWLRLDCRQSQGHLALGLHRFAGRPMKADTVVADRTAAEEIVRSLKERSVSNEELGMFWRDLELSWWWFRAPIETQALMIEVFDEVAKDAAAVEDLKVWLLKQKQTQDWKTTKATADAVYALLLRGANQLASDALVEVSLAGEVLKPEAVEAGTGFFEQRFVGPEIKPQQGTIVLKKTDDGVAWGSVHWQYLEDMSKVTPYDGTPLKLRKTLFVKTPSKKGPVLTPVAGPLAVGDELVVRVELRVDRDMEYIHLKDHRGAGTEPVNVLSQYRYQDGLAYYESTRDTASHFFIDYLPKGTYVFEYSTRVQHKGRYQSGMASIQCMYAPEFNSHSESVWIEAK